MAAILSALKAMGSDVSRLSHEIWFAGLMGEEAGLHGSRALASQETFDFVIVGEPTDLKVVFSHKGSARWHMHAKGLAAHSAIPEAGVNAIDLMFESLLWLKERFRALSVEDPVLGVPTLSVGTIRGGSKINIVPDSCIVEIDMRIVPQFNANLLFQDFRAKWPQIEVAETTAPPLATPREHPLVQKLIGCGAPATVAPWFCDAAAFADRGMPGVAVGPGSIAQAHVADEFLAVDDLDRGTGFFLNFLRSLR
jgi:acetylornithine deacetylase/succinyl-diaminopimelate desuccinylase-like protein